jgi:hypothetical protein
MQALAAITRMSHQSAELHAAGDRRPLDRAMTGFVEFEPRRPARRPAVVKLGKGETGEALFVAHRRSGFEIEAAAEDIRVAGEHGD